MKKSSIYGILSIVLIVGMFFTGCASKNNASQLNTNVSNLPIHQMHASFVYDTDNIREAVGICDYVFVAKVVSCDGTEYRNVITTEDEKGNPKEVGSPYTNYTIQVLENIKGELITDKPDVYKRQDVNGCNRPPSYSLLVGQVHPRCKRCYE